ncbi:MAG: hypothetical protein ACTHKY_04685 [Ginsengibacter sp.]
MLSLYAMDTPGPATSQNISVRSVGEPMFLPFFSATSSTDVLMRFTRSKNNDDRTGSTCE